MVYSTPGQVHTLHRRGGRPQQQQRILPHAAELGHLPGVVAGVVFRLVAGLLLLVQHDETQILYRGKHGGTGADDHPSVSPADALPLVVALSGAQRAVEHGDVVSEVGGEHPQQLRGQGDFRHQDQGTLPPLQHLLDEANVHLGLAAARYAVEQGGRGFLLPAQLVQSLKGGLLLVVEHRVWGAGHVPQGDPAEHLLLLQGEHAALFQGAQGGHRGPGEIT